LKFKFRLERVLNHKKMEKDLAQRDFLEAQSRYQRGLDALEAMYQEVSNAKRYEAAVVTEGGRTAEALKWSAFFIEGQKVRIENQKLTNRQLVQEAEKKQEVLVERARDFKTFEKLKEKVKERYKKEIKKQDMKMTDEIVVMSSNRRPEDG
jgi:flagellar protein FliJ